MVSSCDADQLVLLTQRSQNRAGYLLPLLLQLITRRRTNYCYDSLRKTCETEGHACFIDAISAFPNKAVANLEFGSAAILAHFQSHCTGAG